MPDFADRATIAGTKILDDVEILRPQVQIELDADFKLCRVVVAAFRPGKGPKVCILRGRRRLGSGGRQGEALHVLALHRARGEGVGHGWLSARSSRS